MVLFLKVNVLCLYVRRGKRRRFEILYVNLCECIGFLCDMGRMLQRMMFYKTNRVRVSVSV